MNNKILKSLLAATLVVGSVQAHTNKTFLMPRPVGVNLPMETMGFRELINRKVDDKFGGNFQVAGFYRGGAGKAKLGKYFGLNEHNNPTFEFQASTGTLTKDFNIGYMIHEYSVTAGKASGSIKFEPKHNEYGVRLDYFQDLEKILKGLYLKANLPIVHVENDMKLNVGTVTSAGSNITQANIIDYFKGSYTKAPNTDANAQSYLTNALIDGKRSKTGVADVDLVLGYKFFNKEKYNASINIGLTIPTGNQAEAKYAFEPIYGNNKHFGFGGGLDGMIRVWGDTDHNFNLNAAVNYRYLFQASEKRTLGLKNSSGTAYAWAQYLNLSETTASTKTAGSLTPAANILTQNVDVTPNSQLDGIVGLAYNKGGFTLDLGYNLYCRAKESVKRKDSFTDSSYGVLKTDKEATSTTFGDIEKVITSSDFLTDNCNTPSQFTNSIYGGLTYAFKEWKYPLMLNAGGAYEWVSKNSAVEGWTAMIKAALAF